MTGVQTCALPILGLVMNIGIQPAKSSKEGFTMRNLNSSENSDDEIGLDI